MSKMKTCTKCGETKDAGGFAQRRDKLKSGKISMCLRSQCKLCVALRQGEWNGKNRDKLSAYHSKYQKIWWQMNPGKRKAYKASRRFENALYNVRLAAKNIGHTPCVATSSEIGSKFTGKCHVCGKTEGENGKRLALDHDHSTGAYRGWLCNDCNIILGIAKDSPDHLGALAAYLHGKDS